jgi:hypothetical protein
MASPTMLASDLGESQSSAPGGATFWSRTLTRPDQEPQYIPAWNPDALAFEKMQSEFDEGPCLAG